MKLYKYLWKIFPIVTMIGLLHAGSAAADPAVTEWSILKFPQPQPFCTGIGLGNQQYWNRGECGFVVMTISDSGTEIPTNSIVLVDLVDESDNVIESQQAVWRVTTADGWEIDFIPQPSWPAGNHCLRVVSIDGVTGNFGESCAFAVNALGADVVGPATDVPANSPIAVNGRVYQVNEVPSPLGGQPPNIVETDVAATFKIQLEDAIGTVLYTSLPLTAAGDGTYSHVIPSSATALLTSDANLAIRAIDASYFDLATGSWGAQLAGSGSVRVTGPTGGAVSVHNSFVSSVGWVKPGETYPWRVFVENTSGAAIANARVVIPDVDGMTFTNATVLNGAGTVSFSGGLVDWFVGALAHGSQAVLVVEAVADTTAQDAQIVWKDLSTTAALTWNLTSGPIEDESHGPKVIPPMSSYDTARFGDRPYVVVPADYSDRKHEPQHTGDSLEAKLNDPADPGSTFNHWQEMSFGQLYPNGAIGSAGVATADFTVNWNDPDRTDNEFTFSNNLPAGACAGTDFAPLAGTAAYPERISGGWYQLPRDTAYYGGDKFSVGSLAGAIGGVGPLFAIDDACGPTGKAVYDAAHIADPEINYNDFDTDKDGVVDFFMLVFVGVGGNGVSQTSVPPYDNIWPHSSSLEFYFTDPATGLKGYVSDDQLRSLKDVPQCWIDNTYNSFDDCAAAGGSGDDALPTYVRVGPYNVNPEDAIDAASVISHEYGHSLGLPDFYCTGSKDCYGDWNLMATDKSHHMDIFGKQELGWVVPVPLQPGQTIADNWRSSKVDTGEIHWQQPDGTPYTLSAANGHQNIHNAEAYVAKLPPALVIDPALVGSTEPGHDASPDNVWWSGAGNDFGCPGHTFDIGLSSVEAAPNDTVTIEFGSWWEIEWDWDYGFVLVSTDGGSTFQSLQSNNAYTTPGAFNPNANGCQSQYGNGLTGTSGSYLAATDTADRATGTFNPATRFTTDSYTFVMPSGAEDGLLIRLAYATDPAVAGRGWFIDNLRVSVNTNQVFSTDFEGDDGDGRWFGDGWSLISATLGSQADRAYYMEMRDRSGFDFDGNGENSRAAIAFQPGMLLVITDEVKGYGNTGSGDHPNQSPVDAAPVPGANTPDLNDAAFKASGVSHFNDKTDDGDDGWHDNYEDGSHPSGDWVHNHNCLSFDVTIMEGTDIGPAYPLPDNLVGDVIFDIGPVGPANCGEFIYWPPDTGDFDGDGILDVDDNCVTVPNPGQEDTTDLDGPDGVGDVCDNCLLVSNPDQCDSNLDGYGNICDGDLDNNGIVNGVDLSILRQNFRSTSHKDSDLDCNDVTNGIDMSILRQNFRNPPGPSALAP